MFFENFMNCINTEIESIVLKLSKNEYKKYSLLFKIYQIQRKINN